MLIIPCYSFIFNYIFDGLFDVPLSAQQLAESSSNQGSSGRASASN